MNRQIRLPKKYNPTINKPKINLFKKCEEVNDNTGTANESVKINNRLRDKLILERNKIEEELPLVFISESLINKFTYEQQKKISVTQSLINDDIKNPNIKLSPLDSRMGVIDDRHKCEFCRQIDCPGHYGFIKFNKPIYDPTAIQIVVKVLSSVCNDCGSLLISEDIIRQKGWMKLKDKKRLDEIYKYCKSDVTCIRSINSEVHQPCDKNPTFILNKDVEEIGIIKWKYQSGGKGSLQAENEIPIASDNEQITNVLDIFASISEKDAQLLGFNKGSHPLDLILQGIVVMPNIARPASFYNGEMHNDDYTDWYSKIIKCNNTIEQYKNISTGVFCDKKYGESLYQTVRNFMLGTNQASTNTSREIKSIKSEIQTKGKESIIRNLLMGKRNNYCGRTVAGPAPEVEFGYIRIPKVWQTKLTKPVVVNDTNIYFLTKLLNDAKITHIDKGGLRKLREQYKYNANLTLNIGDICDRVMMDGDRLANNRQPTLHKQSMMAFKAYLSDFYTIGLHLTYTTPMNCDFDGDENNVWVPQSLESEAELEILMNVKNNLMSSEQNTPIMGLVMNSITGIFLLSNFYNKIDEDIFNLLISYLDMTENELDNLKERLAMNGILYGSGASLISALFPADLNYTSKNTVKNKDQPLIISSGVLVTGKLTKKQVGTKPNSIIQMLHKKYRSERLSKFFTYAPWIINKWLVEYGFTTGLRDIINIKVDSDGNQYDENRKLVKEKLAEVKAKVRSLDLPPDATKDQIYYYELKVRELTDVAKSTGDKIAMETFSSLSNNIGVMSDVGGGAKGTVSNVGQMMGVIGQQYYQGERIKPTITNNTRTLPLFDVNDTSLKSRGFIEQSFYMGMDVAGLFFSLVAGRENLLDTALNVSTSGYIQRLMNKSLEPITIAYDGSVRNLVGTMFSTIYNTNYTISEQVPVNDPTKKFEFEYSNFVNIDQIIHDLNNKAGWITKDTYKQIEENRKQFNIPVEKNLNLPKTDEILVDINKPVKTLPTVYKITNFEKARLIAIRAHQIANNSPPLVDIDDIMDVEEIDPIKIASREYDAGILPLYVIRSMPDGTIEKIYPTLDNIRRYPTDEEIFG